ncbi:MULTISPECIES: acyl-CoA thioesterase [unclassified Micromonospora]|uniref:acyl-CoA thioesterase n=1 Tax=unclassified Micromonospora TaxID=2617518 RepID=UPI003A889B34
MNGLHDVRRRVEHVDTDAGGVVHFSRYASLLETALLDNLERLGVGVGALVDAGLDLTVTELQVRYRAPAKFPDPLRIAVRVQRLGGAYCQIAGAVHRESGGVRGGDLLADGSLRICVTRRSDGAATALPDPLRAALRDCLNGDPDG